MKNCVRRSKTREALARLAGSQRKRKLSQVCPPPQNSPVLLYCYPKSGKRYLFSLNIIPQSKFGEAAQWTLPCSEAEQYDVWFIILWKCCTILCFSWFLTTFFLWRLIETCKIHYEMKQMLPYSVISGNLPTYFLKNVGKIAANLKNVQHRHDSTMWNTWNREPLF